METVPFFLESKSDDPFFDIASSGRSSFSSRRASSEAEAARVSPDWNKNRNKNKKAQTLPEVKHEMFPRH